MSPDVHYVPQDQKIILKFHVGTQYCVLTFKLDNFELILNKLRSFFYKENIPENLHNVLESAVIDALKQEKLFPIKHSEDITNRDLMIENARLLHRKFQITSQMDIKTQQQSKSNVEFSKMLQYLTKNDETREMISSLEQSFSLTMINLHKSADEEIAQLIEKQSREMERASLGEQGERIAILVEKHVKEMESLENKWRNTIAEAKRRQKAEYHAFITNLYKNKDQYLDSYNPIKQEKKTQSLSSSPSKLNLQSSQKRSYSLTSIIFGKNTNEPVDNTNEASNTSSEIEKVKSHSLIVMLGSQLKKPIEIKIIADNILSFCRSRTEKDGLDPVYGNSLKACVLIIDTNLANLSPNHVDFIKECNKTTELHFDEIDQQLENVKNQNGGEKLNVGDFFVTTHSNLKGAHVVFHLAVERKHDHETTAKLLSGLNNILTVANRYDVEELSIPVLLIQNELRHLLSDKECSHRVEEIVKAIKLFLMQNGVNSTLKRLNLVTPPNLNDESIFSQTKSLIMASFNIQ